MRVPAALYRGGTSRGLLLRAGDVAQYTPAQRDAILCAAMGSPDPDGRQVDGMGGGTSSLSKAALVSAPGQGLYTRVLRELGQDWQLPGVPWADDVKQASDPVKGWDVVYRFGQVPINGTTVDWSSTCGNLVASVALFAIHNQLVPFERLTEYAQQHGRQDTMAFPLRILLACSGERVEATVPLMRHGAHDWAFSDVADTTISGVPGTAPGISIAFPLEASPLPTGHVRDVLDVNGLSIPVTIINAGLPVVFVHAQDVGVDGSYLAQSAAALDTDAALHARLERIRQCAATRTPALQNMLCTSAPKIVVIHPRTAYTTSAGTPIDATSMDLLVRAVSVGQFHRTIPATVLSALAVGGAYPTSVVGTAMAQGGATSPSHNGFFVVRAGQPAGISTATVALEGATPTSIVMPRTARRIMEGYADVPPHVVPPGNDAYAALYQAYQET